MKVLVLLAVVGACVAFPQTFLLDTPEVQAERQRFFQLYNAAAAAAAAAPDDPVSTQQAFRAAPSHHVVPQTTVWTGPLASEFPAGVQGPLTQVADTPEVAAAKNAFQSAFQQQIRATVPRAHPNAIHFPAPVQQPTPGKWTGPLAATLPAGVPGAVSQVRNTPEVEAAIAEFTNTYNAAVRAAIPVSNNVFSNLVHQQPAIQQPVVQQRWVGPLASNTPAGLPGSGPVADTADVATARANFNRAFQQQLAAVLG